MPAGSTLLLAAGRASPPLAAGRVTASTVLSGSGAADGSVRFVGVGMDAGQLRAIAAV
ncbi:MAG: hypothetical protein OHK0044_32930 [Burkholderiaceae bacterium]